MRLSPAFLDLFLTLIIVVMLAVRPEAEAEEAPPEMAHFVVTATWATSHNDVDLWGKRIGARGSECGYTRREVGNLILRNDWTSSSYGRVGDDDGRQRVAHETMTINDLHAGTYGFSLQGYRVSDGPVSVQVQVVSVQPYRVLVSREVMIENGGWTPIARITLDSGGNVTDVDTVTETNFTPGE